MIAYIYKIVNFIDKSIYVGSTWYKLYIRYSKHKNDYNCKKCNFTGNKSHFNRHCKSKKHKELESY